MPTAERTVTPAATAPRVLTVHSQLKNGRLSHELGTAQAQLDSWSCTTDRCYGDGCVTPTYRVDWPNILDTSVSCDGDKPRLRQESVLDPIGNPSPTRLLAVPQPYAASR